MENFLEVEYDVKSVEVIEHPSDGDQGEESSDEEVIISPEEKLDYAFVTGGKKRGPKPKFEPKKIFPCDLCTYTSGRPADLRRHFIRLHTKPLKKKQVDQVKRKMAKEREKEKLEEDIKELAEEDGKLKHSVVTKGRKRGPKIRYSADAKFPCTHCTYISTRKFDLKRHIASVHNKEKPFHCDVCNYATGLAETLKQHMLKVHNEMKFKCIECNYSCLNQTEFTRHLMSNHNYNPHSCTACSFSCSSYNDLKKHIMVEHKDQKPFRCSNCDYQTCHHSSLVKHINYFHTKETLKCPLCEFTTNDGKMALNEHKKFAHPSKTRLTKERRRKKKEMETAIVVVTDDHHNQDDRGIVVIESMVDVMDPAMELYYCDLCTFTTISERELNCHLTDIHNREKLFICPCSFTTMKKFHFKSHLRLEHGRPDDQLEKLALDSMKVVGTSPQKSVSNKPKVQSSKPKPKKSSKPKKPPQKPEENKILPVNPVNECPTMVTPSLTATQPLDPLPHSEPTIQYTNLPTDKTNEYTMNAPTVNYSLPSDKTINYSSIAPDKNVNYQMHQTSKDMYSMNQSSVTCTSNVCNTVPTLNKCSNLSNKPTTSSMNINMMSPSNPSMNYPTLQTNKAMNYSMNQDISLQPKGDNYPLNAPNKLTNSSNMNSMNSSMNYSMIPGGLYPSQPSNLNYSTNPIDKSIYQMIPTDKSINYLTHLTNISGMYTAHQNINYFAHTNDKPPLFPTQTTPMNYIPPSSPDKSLYQMNTSDKYLMQLSNKSLYQTDHTRDMAYSMPNSKSGIYSMNPSDKSMN